AERSRAPLLSQLLSAERALAAHGDPPREGRPMSFGTTGASGSVAAEGVRLLDLSPPRTDAVRCALEGLSRTPKTLPSKLLYDAAGSALFERITELEAYYPTRTERAILEARLAEI